MERIPKFGQRREYEKYLKHGYNNHDQMNSTKTMIILKKLKIPSKSKPFFRNFQKPLISLEESAVTWEFK